MKSRGPEMDGANNCDVGTDKIKQKHTGAI